MARQAPLAHCVAGAHAAAIVRQVDAAGQDRAPSPDRRYPVVHRPTTAEGGHRRQPLTVHRWSTPSVDWLLVVGRLSGDTVHALSSALRDCHRRRPATAVINFSGLTGIDVAAHAVYRRELARLMPDLRVLVLGPAELQVRSAGSRDG